MRRKEFLRSLKEELKKRRDIEVEEVLFYYDELIQDAVDSGESEEVFIMNLGSVRDICFRLVEDKEFITEVKSKNDDVVRDVLSTTVKVIGYLIFGIAAFSLGVAVISVFFSGISVIVAAIVKLVISGPSDVYGYLVLLGVAMVGASLMLLSIGIVKWFINKAKPALLTIFRNTKDFMNKRGKE